MINLRHAVVVQLMLAGLALGQTDPRMRKDPPALPSSENGRNYGPGFTNGSSTGVPAPSGFIITPSTWTALGPAPLGVSGNIVSGRLAGVAVDPTNSNVIYVAAAGGGVWKSTDGGASYTPLTDTQSTLAMGAIAIAPTNSLKIYAGTGEANNSADSNFGRGILVSNDGGASWTLATGPGNVFDKLTVSKISVDPTQPSVAYAAMGNVGQNAAFVGTTGVFKTTDGGVTWVNLTSSINTSDSWSDVVVDPNNSSIVYAALGAFYGVAANGVYRSTNGGSSWTLMPGSPSGTNAGRIALAVAPSATTANQHILYAVAASTITSGLYQAAVSLNADAASPTFATIAGVPNFMGGQAWYDIIISVDPANAYSLYAAGSAGAAAIQRITSTNSGSSYTFTAIATAGGVTPHADSHAMAWDSLGRLILGGDGGAWRYDKTGATSWTNINGNLNTNQFTGIGLHPTNTSIVVGGTQDNGTEVTTGAIQWTETDGGDGGASFIGKQSGTRCYSVHPIGSYGTGSYFRTSTDTCNNWTSATTGITGASTNFYPPIFVDPTNDSRVFLGGTVLYETTNAGASWSAHTATSDGSTLDAIAVVPGGSTYYISTGGTFASKSNVYKSTDSGTNWANLNFPAVGRVNDLEIDPSDATGNTVVATISTFSSGGQIYRTTNGGTTWTNINGNLPNIPTWSAKFDVDTNRTLYVSNEVAVYSSPSPYSTWTVYGTGLPRAQGVDLQINTSGSNRMLAVGTHGRGAWAIGLPPLVTITTNPQALTQCAGTTASLTAAATGTPAPTVQWQVSTDGGVTFNNIPGATSTTVSLGVLAAGMNGNLYQAVFTNSTGSVKTTAALLTVNTSPTTTAPTSTSVLAGATATFSVIIGGRPTPPVQWQVSTDGGVNFTDIAGATSSVLSFTAQAADSGKQYRVVLAGVCGTATSRAATLTVKSLVSIAVTPANPTLNPGQTQQFTATGTYSDTSTANLTSTVTWASDTMATATITAGGLATAAAGGTSTISATLGSTVGSTLLTVNPSVTPPTVVSYNVLFGTAGSYNVIGSARNRLPWSITAIQVVFSKPITAGNVKSLSGVSATGFSGLGTTTLTWTVNPITNLPLTATSLAGTGINALTDSSGNGLAGGAGFAQNLKVLYGDYNDDGVVNVADQTAVLNLVRSSTYSMFGDMNGDGVVSNPDVLLVRGQIGQSLP